MTNLDNFKNFVKKNPNLVTYVRSNEMTWQKFYEMYDLYGENNEVWNTYLKKDVSNGVIPSHSDDRNKTGSSFASLIEMAKRVDPDKLQDGISSIQKAIGLFGDMLVKDNKNDTPSNNYTPRPIYRKFDD